MNFQNDETTRRKIVTDYWKTCCVPKYTGDTVHVPTNSMQIKKIWVSWQQVIRWHIHPCILIYHIHGRQIYKRNRASEAPSLDHHCWWKKKDNNWGLISKSYIFQMSITRIVALTLFSFLILVLVPSTFIPKMSLIPACPPMPIIWEGRKCNEITEFGKLKSKQEKKMAKIGYNTII